MHVRDHPLNLSGSICALATPFGGDGDVLDLPSIGRLIDHQLAAGTRALVVAGSTGEAAALDGDEFSELLQFAVRRVAGRVPVFAGTGQQSTAKTIEQTRVAASIGADFALVVTPPYVRPTQEGLHRHYCQVADHGGLPIMLYNVPPRTGCDLLPETVACLVDHPNIIGIKEARPERERMQALIALRHERFRVFSGDDPTCARAIGDGADGVISVAANVAPAAMQRLCELVVAAEQADVAALQARLSPLFDVLGAEPNPIPLKWCLQQLGFGAALPRLPLLSFSPAHHALATQVLASLGLLHTGSKE